MAQGMVSVLPSHPGDFRIYNYTNVAAQTGSSITVLKLGGGVLHGFMVSNAGSAATAQLLVLDSTASGSNVIWTISGTQAATTFQSFGMDVAFTTALAIQSQAVTATSPTLTVLWK